MGHFARMTAAAMAAVLASVAPAQDYPHKVIKLVNPYPPGGASDALARLVAQELGTRLGQSIVVEAIAGAGGSIGTAQVARAEPDGYTLLFASTGNIAINPWLYKSLGYDVVADFAPVALIGATDLVLVAAPGTPFGTANDVVEAARRKPGGVTCAHAGSGTINHLTLVLWKVAAKVDCLEVPYKGAGPALTDVMGGQVHVFFATVPSILTLASGKKLKPLATTGVERSSALSSQPTLREAGLAGFQSTLWFGLSAPAKTPPAVLAKLRDAVKAMLADDGVRTRLVAMSVEPRHLDADAFARYIAEELQRWRTAVETSGATAQ